MSVILRFYYVLFQQMLLIFHYHYQSPDTVEERNFLSFCMPSNIQLEDKSEFSSWCDRMIFIFEDLKWLLSLPVPQFWNQVSIINKTYSFSIYVLFKKKIENKKK